MKYSANQGRISSFVVGETGSEYGPPVAVIYNAAAKATSAEPSPRWAIGTGQLGCLQFRSGTIARRGGRRQNTIWHASFSSLHFSKKYTHFPGKIDRKV
ncbi:hypothetical protein [Desulfocicer vacuolatum]|uniref:hypothetical protein n=1 Tax=Desulfocicer vacuolatum TaxID=2298 RepID=UPI001BB00A0D|nr:hypothetical protein [Desulfocicer vacuolatum]